MYVVPPIPEPDPGDSVSASWGRAIVRALRSMRLVAGPGARVSATPSGTTVSLAPERGAGASHEGTVPLVANVIVGIGTRSAGCRTLDGRSVGTRLVAPIELAGGPSGPSAECIVYPSKGRVALVNTVSQS